MNNSEETSRSEDIARGLSKATRERRAKQRLWDRYKEVETIVNDSIIRALRRADNKSVIIKTINFGGRDISRWYCDEQGIPKVPLEIHVMQRIANEASRQNINYFIQYFEHYELKDNVFMVVMEDLGKNWEDLDAYSSRGPVKNAGILLQITRQVVNAAETLREVFGFYHGDLKESNVLINKRTRKIKVIDFGSATTTQQEYQPGCEFRGTITHQAPEIDHSSTTAYSKACGEAWALGSMVFRLALDQGLLYDDQESFHDDAVYARLRGRIRSINYKSCNSTEGIKTALYGLLERDPNRRIKLAEIKNLFICSPLCVRSSTTFSRYARNVAEPAAFQQNPSATVDNNLDLRESTIPLHINEDESCPNTGDVDSGVSVNSHNHYQTQETMLNHKTPLRSSAHRAIPDVPPPAYMTREQYANLHAKPQHSQVHTKRKRNLNDDDEEEEKAAKKLNEADMDIDGMEKESIFDKEKAARKKKRRVQNADGEAHTTNTKAKADEKMDIVTDQPTKKEPKLNRYGRIIWQRTQFKREYGRGS
ncbi:Serine/threonine-protein kinase pim-2 [Blyttiomyces sp. JEL0837]|nr:Serine/threonine-protein kinase pim-2 [Blyttiomyces sp. JEL0837]